MKVGRYNYAAQFENNVDELLEKYKQILFKGNYILTSDVTAFNTAFAQYLEVDHARGVNTGTDALIVALLALGVGAGDEVITQANTFNATVAAIRLVGATPVLVDVEPEGFTINVEQMAAAISSRTRVLMPVHLYGRPAPMTPILKLAEKYDLVVVEDAAQAVGARYQGQRVGSIGDIGCFSFHPSKNLAAAGDAGAVITQSTELDELMRQRGELGQTGQNIHNVVGLNTKLDAMQALVLLAKLPKLEEWNNSRARIAQMYKSKLASTPLRFQAEGDNETHVWHLFQVRTDKRDNLLQALKADGVDAVIRYPTPIHLQGCFTDQNWKTGQFPVSESLAEELLCLPIRPDLSQNEIEYVCNSVHRFFGTS